MEPTKKNPGIVNLMESITGRKRDGKSCMTCGSTKVKPEDFRDALSRKEFTISCMCQKCQDSVFGG